MNQKDKLRFGVHAYLNSEKGVEDAQRFLLAQERKRDSARMELARLIKACGHELILGNQRFCVENSQLLVKTYDAIVLEARSSPPITESEKIHGEESEDENSGGHDETSSPGKETQ